MSRFYEKCISCVATIKSDKGQTIVEYGLLLVLIAVVAIIMMNGLGSSSNSLLSKINSSMP